MPIWGPDPMPIDIERTSPHLEFRVEVGYDIGEKFFQNFAQTLAEGGRVLLDASEHAGPLLHRLASACHASEIGIGERRSFRPEGR